MAYKNWVTIRLNCQQVRKIDGLAYANDTTRGVVLRQLIDRTEMVSPDHIEPDGQKGAVSD